MFDDARAVEKVLSSTKANNLTLRNDRGEFRLNIEEKRARQARQSTGGGFVGKPGSTQPTPAQHRSNRSTSNGSNGGGGSGGGDRHINGKKPASTAFRGGEDDAPKRTAVPPAGASYQRRS